MWEKKPVLLLLLATAAILVGTIVTMVLPFAWVNTEHDRIETVTPYNALEQEGRDVYIREGCNNCHSQTVRPLVSEVLRYGEYSKSGEFVYDRPFLWGSKRTGPDLARIGGKYPDAWHEKHFASPRDFYPQSNMPEYGWLADNKLKPAAIRRNMDVNGFPYTEEEIDDLASRTELNALTAYMQVIGTAVKKSAPPVEVSVPLDGRNPFAGGAGYNASKFGLLGLSEVMMLDLRYEGIRVSIIMPGSVDTSFGGRPAGEKEGWALTSEDVGKAVLDLISYPGNAHVSRVEMRPSRPTRKK